MYILGGQELFYQLFYQLGTDMRLARLAASNIVHLVFVGLFGFVIFGGFFSTIKNIFYPRDMDFLLSHSLKFSSIFRVKFIETLITISWMVFTASIPVFIGYGRFLDAPWYYYPVSFLVLMLFILIPASIGIGLNLIIVKVFTKKTVTVITFILGLALSFVVVFYLNEMNRELVISGNMTQRLFDFLVRIDDVLEAKVGFNPMYIASNSVINLAYNNIENFYNNFYRLLAESTILFFAVLFFYPYLYSKKLFSYRLDFKRTIINKNNEFSKKSKRWWVWKKELHNFIDDIIYWPQIFIIIGIIVIYALHIDGLTHLFRPSSLNTSVIINNVFVGMIVVSLAGRYIYPSLSGENGYYWILKSAPLKLSDWMYKKFFVYFIVLLVAAQVMITTFNLRINTTFSMHILSWLYVFFTVFMVTVLGYLFGVLFLNFKEPDIWKIATNAGGILYLITGFIMVTFISMIILIPSSTPSGFRLIPTLVGASLILASSVFLLKLSTKLLKQHYY